MSPPNKKELSGKIFGRLTVWQDTGKRNPKGEVFWLCQCACGNFCEVRSSSLVNGNTRSCGCLQRESMKNNGKKNHNFSLAAFYPRENSSWRGAKRRCIDSSNKDFHYYGARGIFMCREWIDDFLQFLLDMGPCPPNYTLDRRENNGPYSVSNCRWTTRKEQQNNKSDNVILEFQGIKKTIMQWSFIVGISRDALYGRKKIGWSDERILTTPCKGKGGINV